MGPDDGAAWPLEAVATPTPTMAVAPAAAVTAASLAAEAESLNTVELLSRHRPSVLSSTFRDQRETTGRPA
jgi:hypothetical protein